MAFNNYEIKEDYAIIKIERRNGDIFDVLLDIKDLNILIEIGKPIGIYFNTNKIPYARIVINKKVYPLHRFLLNYEGEKLVDHINNNSLDCRKDNLRITNYSKNAKNCKYKTNTHIKGITRENKNCYIASKIFEGITFQCKAQTLEEAKRKMEKIDKTIKVLIDSETFEN